MFMQKNKQKERESMAMKLQDLDINCTLFVQKYQKRSKNQDKTKLAELQ